MDGCKGKLTGSLQFRLSIGAAIVVLGVALLASSFSYWWVFAEAIELQDKQLIQLSALVNHQCIIHPDLTAPVEISTADPESHFVMQWLDPALEQARTELPGLPVDLPEGLYTYFVRGVSWRLLVKTFSNGSRILVGQQTKVRDEIARASALNALISPIVLIMLLLLWVAYLIRQVFSPLKKMATQLNQRTDHDLMPLPDENLATEIAPFIAAINHLLARVRDSIAQQRQFVRDAAHELRSPLTAISLQTERLVDLGLEFNLHTRLVKLHYATERTRILIEQLLTMARTQDEKVTAKVSIPVKALLCELLEDLLPLAEMKKIEVSVIGEDVHVHSRPIELQSLMKNLIENSIRYTSQGGYVEILLTNKNGNVELTVRHSGPGITDDDLVRVFDPFYRALGNDQSASGLLIVQTIANRLGLTVELYNNSLSNQTELFVRLIFPNGVKT